MKAHGSKAATLQALCNEGVALHRSGRLEEAGAFYKKVLQRDPRHFEALHLLAVICTQTDQDDLSLALTRRAIAANPKAGVTHSLQGAVLCKMGRFAQSLASHDRAIALEPDNAEAHTNRANTLHQMGRHADALASAEAAIAADPNCLLAHHNRSVALQALARPVEAAASYEAAIALEPEFTAARFGRSLALLQAGRLEAGWPDYELRRGAWPAQTPRYDDARLWLGTPPLDGKRLLVHCEQGLGDTIQFYRYLALLEGRGGSPVFAVQNALKPLLRRLSPTIEVIGEDEPPPAFDFHCPLMSLPLAFATTLETIPSPGPYLSCEPERRAAFEARLPAGARPRIGLAWSGSADHARDHDRSIAFERLAPMLSQDADWFAVQNDVRAADAAAFDAFGEVRFLGEALADFEDTAALVDLMDLVVTVDTSVAHLAAAMGKPVWILLPFDPDWRWLLDRSDSPWYPTARLFRQPGVGDWASVIEAVGTALAERFGGAPAPD
jgi:Tfp pilus assembly protein PilF